MEILQVTTVGPPSRAKWSDAHLPLRIAATQEAIKRARFAFFLCILAASASFVCLWNAHISWYRGFGFKDMPGIHETEPNHARESTRGYLIQDELKAWVDGQSISINLLGIRISVSDFAVLNSLALYAFVYYYLLAARRENREVGQLLRDVRDNLDSTGYTVYAAISSYMVFNLNRGDDSPIAKLEPDETETPEKFGVLRKVIRFLFLFPLFVVLFTIGCDFGSLLSRSHLFFSSPFRDARIWDVLGTNERAFAVAMELVALFLAFGILRLNLYAMRYENATRSVMDEFKTRLATSESTPEASVLVDLTNSAACLPENSDAL